MDEHEAAGGDDEHIEKVRRRAHAIWLDEGMAHGRDQEHWHQAEQEIAAEEAERASPSKAVEPTQSSGKVAEQTTEATTPQSPPKR